MTKKKEELGVSTEVKKIDLATNFLPSQDELNIMTAIVKAVTAGTRNPAGAGTALNIALTARELGLPIMGAVNGLLYTVGGKVGMSALTMRHLIKQQGHTFDIVEEEDTHAIVYGKRRDNGKEMTVKYTMEQAKKAGYVKKDGNYETVPSDMMLARATAKLARRLFEDVIASCPYTTEELKDIDDNKDDDPKIIDAEVTTPEDDKLTEDIAAAAKTGNDTTEEDAKASATAAAKKKAKAKKESKAKDGKKDELTPAEKRAATRAKKLKEKEEADKKAQEDKKEVERQEKLEAEAKEKADKEGEVVDAEVVEKVDTPREALQVKVGINSETDDRFKDLITVEEVDKALEYASSNNGEDIDEMVERILDDETFNSFWTWLSNYIFDQRGNK